MPSPTRRKLIFSFLLILFSVLVYRPFLNYQPWLAQGDHGNQLYIFYLAFLGHLPYRSAFSVYGPLMPYYFALFFFILGAQIKSVLLAKLILSAASVVVFYWTLEALTLSSGIALLGAVWFLLFNSEFVHCYNHAGGILAMLVSSYFLFAYFRKQKKIYVYAGAFSLFALLFIKLNIGLSTTAAFLASSFVMDRSHGAGFILFRDKKILLFYLFSWLAVFGVYFFLFYGLPSYYTNQCLPYWGGKLTKAGISLEPVAYIFEYFVDKCALFVSPKAVMILALLSSADWALSSPYKSFKIKSGLFIPMIAVILFYFFSIHEFLLNPDFSYKIFWGDAFLALGIFALIERLFLRLGKFRPVGVAILACVLAFDLCLVLLPGKTPPKAMEPNEKFDRTSPAMTRYFMAEFTKPSHFVPVRGAEIYVNNDADWISTVKRTVDFLNSHLKKDETFFALPYDPLYYFLTQKTAPVRETIFFDLSHMPPEQEVEIIRSLEDKKVDYVLLSSRQHSFEPSLGFFGYSYCPILAQYLYKNFRGVAIYGNWNAFPRWAQNHAVLILKRTAYLK